MSGCVLSRLCRRLSGWLLLIHTSQWDADAAAGIRRGRGSLPPSLKWKMQSGVITELKDKFSRKRDLSVKQKTAADGGRGRDIQQGRRHNWGAFGGSFQKRINRGVLLMCAALLLNLSACVRQQRERKQACGSFLIIHFNYRADRRSSVSRWRRPVAPMWRDPLRRLLHSARQHLLPPSSTPRGSRGHRRRRQAWNARRRRYSPATKSSTMWRCNRPLTAAKKKTNGEFLNLH